MAEVVEESADHRSKMDDVRGSVLLEETSRCLEVGEVAVLRADEDPALVGSPVAIFHNLQQFGQCSQG